MDREIVYFGHDSDPVWRRVYAERLYWNLFGDVPAWVKNPRILVCIEHEGKTYWANRRTGKWEET